jgi:hypothetical protein
MNSIYRATTKWSLQALCIAALCFAAVAPVRSQDKKADPSTDPKAADPGFYCPIAGAKDCAFDESRNRLYVTTPKKLVVVDTKQKKVIESIELLGGLQACDISPDFKYLAVGPVESQSFYWIKLDWTKADDMDISQIKFKAGANETGVYSLCVGADNSVLFTTTVSGSAGVPLRLYDAKTGKVSEVGMVFKNSVVFPSGDRQYAAALEGAISNCPLKLFDFKEQKSKLIKELGTFSHEVGCAREAKYFARPQAKGCDLLDSSGGRLGTVGTKPVICAAFHPKRDTLFVMQHGELSVQEFDVEGRTVSNDYPLDKPLVISADVKAKVVADLQPLGKDAVMANFRKIVTVRFHAYDSGRLRVSESGDKLVAVLPTGIYVFPVKPYTKSSGPKIKVVDTDPKKNRADGSDEDNRNSQLCGRGAVRSRERQRQGEVGCAGPRRFDAGGTRG